MTLLALVLGLLVVVNVWVHLGPRRAHVVTGPVAALGLLLLARRAGCPGPTWACRRRTRARACATARQPPL